MTVQHGLQSIGSIWCYGSFCIQSHHTAPALSMHIGILGPGFRKPCRQNLQDLLRLRTGRLGTHSEIVNWEYAID